MKTITRRNLFWVPPCGAFILLFIAFASLPVQAQTTLLFYRLNDTDSNSVASGIIPNYLGTLGYGTNGGTGITLTNDIPTNGVPPGSGNRAFDGHGTGGVRSQGLLQLNRTNISNAGGFTYEAWFKYNGGSGINAIIDYAGTEKLVRRNTDSGPDMEINSSSFYPIAAAAANQWHYAAAVFTPTNTVTSGDTISGYLTLYLDGNQPVGTVQNVLISNFGDSLDRTIGVGIHPALAVDYFNGFIYEPRVTLGALPGNKLLFKPGYVVTNASDTGPGSLRYAVSAAPSGAVITFAPALSGQTIRLTNGSIVVGNNVTIDGSTLTNGITLDGGNHSAIFIVDNSFTVGLNSLTLTNGNADNTGGGAVYNGGTLTINNCTFINNHANSFNASVGGGAIYNGGTLTVNNSTFMGNYSDGFEGYGAGGGAIWNQAGTMTMNNTTFTGNYAINNQYGGGGAIQNTAQTMANNCTLYGDSDGGTAGNEIAGNTFNVNLTNCIIAGASPLGISIGTGCLFTNNPLLAPIGNYGGPTETMPPLAGSPAVNAGLDSVTNFLLTDQRGFSRLSWSHVDIGADELQLNSLVNNLNDSGPGSLRYVVTNVPPNSLVTFDVQGQFSQTITLASEIVLGNSVTIDASSVYSGTNGMTISGGNAARLFSVSGGVTAVFRNLTLTGGNGVGTAASGYGGAIFNQGNLTLTNCALINNNATIESGGAVENTGALTVQQSALSVNYSGNVGGAIDNYGTLAIQQSALANNFALYFGGAIDDESASSANFSEDTLAENTAGQVGGAIANYNANLTLVHCSLAGNQTTNSGASYGGGAINCNITTLNLSYCILAGDYAASGNGPEITTNAGASTINATNCLISNGANSGVTNGLNANLVGSPALPLNANIAPLGNWGGPTLTMPPLPGSPAIDAAVSSTATVDQRGVPRPQPGNYGAIQAYDDIGAVESQIQYVTNSADGGPGSLRQLVADSPVGGAIGFAPDVSGDTLMLTNEISINQSLAIDANALPGGYTLNGGNAHRVFFNVANAFLSGLQLANGNGVGQLSTGFGGALFNGGDLTLDRCTVTNSSASFGGGILNQGNLTVNQCTIEGNSSYFECGGILGQEGNLEVNQSTIIANTTSNVLTGGGGGITAENGSIFGLSNSIVALNNAPAGYAQNIYYNGAFTSANNITNGNPNLAPLGYYGGPTPTMPPLPGSPAVDAGIDSFTNIFVTDQRGYPRLAGAHVDIGAVEGVYSVKGPGKILTTFPHKGAFTITYTNLTDANLPILINTNLAQSANWTIMGFATESPAGSGQFQFTDSRSTNNPRAFYWIRNP